MKKLLTLSFISASLLFSGSPIHDKMDSRIKGQSFSGTLDDNVAAQDGLGVLPLQHHTGTTDMNNELLVQRVFKRIVQTETDKTKTINIRTSLTAGTVGSSVDQNLLSNAGFVSSYQSGTLGSCYAIKAAYPASTSGEYVTTTSGKVYCDMETDGGGWTLVDSYDGVNGDSVGVRHISTNVDPNATQARLLPAYNWSSSPKLLCKSTHYSGSLPWVTFNVLTSNAKLYPTTMSTGMGLGSSSGHYSYDQLNGNTAQGTGSWVDYTSGRIGTIWIGNGGTPTCACGYMNNPAVTGLGSTTSAKCSVYVK